MNSMLVIALGNIVVWGVIVALMVRLAARERDISDSLADLERRARDN